MSDQRENRFELRRDGLGIVLFTAGAFFSVLLVLALASSEPLEQTAGTAALARIWAGSIGLLPALVFCGGSAILGAHLFLVGDSRVKRRAGGLALVSLGLSVLLGAFTQSAGGIVGSATAGALSRSSHVAVGVLFGLAVLGGAVWVAWMRPARVGRRDASLMEAGADEVEVDPVKVASPQPSDLGVTAAEAAALIPEDPPSWRAEPRKKTPLPAIPSVAIPTHREDIRRRGEVPEGARPLLPPYVHTPASPGSSRPIDEPSASSVQHWAPPVEPEQPADPADEDLALPEEPEAVLQPFRASSLEPLEAVDEPEVEAEIEEELIEIEEELEAEEDELEEEEELAESEDLGPSVSEPVLRPSWEQPTLFQEGEEPVDAYGTPMSLVTPQAEAVDPEEPDVVLKPTAPPAKQRVKGRSQAKERSRFLAEVGCLFVDRGRVAVSMLQKQFDMDFEEATEVLDDLQALGLIGPYLGGQRRDILLTRDEWLEKVSSL